MFRDYMVTSPSLDGVLRHESIGYEGFSRPSEILRICDRVNSKKTPRTEEEQKTLEDYFHDVYGVFMKKLSYFIVAAEADSAETIKLQALLQEMIKIKKLLAEEGEVTA